MARVQGFRCGWGRWLMPFGLLLPAVLVGCSSPEEIGLDEGKVVAIREALEVEGAIEVVEEELPDPNGFADFVGTFRVVGSVPTPAPLKVDADIAVCTESGNPVDEGIVAGPNGELKNVLIYLNRKNLPDTEAWEHEDYRKERDILLAGRERGFDQEGCVFLTHVFAMRSTQSLEVLNSDPVGHNTNIQSNGLAAAKNFLVPAGTKQVYAPENPSDSVFPVTCNIHSWMQSYMIVRDNPYFAVTDDQGKFVIRNVPSGVPLEFRVWQESAKYLKNVTVAVGGGTPAPAKWSQGKFTIELTPDQTYQMDVTIDISEF